MNEDREPISPWPLAPLDARVLGGLRGRISQFGDGKSITLKPRVTMKWERIESEPAQPYQPPICPGTGKCLDIAGNFRPCDSLDNGPFKVRSHCSTCCDELMSIRVGFFVTMTSCEITTCVGGLLGEFVFAQRQFKATYLSTNANTPSYPCGSCCDLYIIERLT